MNRHRNREHWRDALPGRKPEAHFRWRGHEVSRLEGFTDAVFAFAVTLLIVALEVPHDYDGLVDALKGFPAFVVCFTLLMLLWNAHYRYFRRYGLNDRLTRLLTMGILLLVLFSVYPLKFLFGAILSSGSAHAPHIQTWEQLQTIYATYGLGFAGIWGLYTVLYLHALTKREELSLSPAEVMQTRLHLIGFVINVAVCLLSVGISRLSVSPGLPGFAYVLLAPGLALNYLWHGRQIRALTGAAAPTRH